MQKYNFLKAIAIWFYNFAQLGSFLNKIIIFSIHVGIFGLLLCQHFLDRILPSKTSDDCCLPSSYRIIRTIGIR